MAGPTRGSLGRRRERDARLPPGQYDVGADWPVLTAEATPRIPPETWELTVDGLVERRDLDVGRGPPVAAVCLPRRHAGTPGASSATRLTEPSARRPAGPGGWRTATVVEVRRPAGWAVALRLDVAGRVEHLPGQHYVVRLTAEDGYSAQRAYSVASAPSDPLVELFVERFEEGEVSGFLAAGALVVGTREGVADRPAGRLTAAADVVPLLRPGQRAYVCGAAPFAEAASQLLVDLGMPAGEIRVERFGPSG